MKFLKFSIMASVCALALSACNNHNNDDGPLSGETQIASLPNAQICSQGLPATAIGPYQSLGFRPYRGVGFGPVQDHRGPGPHGRGHVGGVHRRIDASFEVGCEAGYQPVCDPNLGGLTCAPIGLFQGQQLALYGMNPQGTFGYTGYGNPFTNGGYANQVGQLCQLGAPSCGYGVCRPLNGGAVGVCTQQ